MTMGSRNTCQPNRRAFETTHRWAVIAIFCTCSLPVASFAQSPPRVHYLHHEYLPPGVIGQEQLRRHPGMPGYFQAVELLVPDGTHISVVENGAFSQPKPGPLLAGMQVG